MVFPLSPTSTSLLLELSPLTEFTLAPLGEKSSEISSAVESFVMLSTSIEKLCVTFCCGTSVGDRDGFDMSPVWTVAAAVPESATVPAKMLNTMSAARITARIF
jgi:hypothetical protein